jgi:hypothetical protein
MKNAVHHAMLPQKFYEVRDTEKEQISSVLALYSSTCLLADTYSTARTIKNF